MATIWWEGGVRGQALHKWHEGGGWPWRGAAQDAGVGLGVFKSLRVFISCSHKGREIYNYIDI